MSEIIRSPSAHRTMWKALADKAYRHAYAAAHVGDYLAMQVHSMRVRRGWTQAELADESGNSQPQISKWETSCEGVNLNSLHKLAAAFGTTPESWLNAQKACDRYRAAKAARRLPRPLVRSRLG